MIPIQQTRFVVKDQDGNDLIHGNCFPAVIASMLELTIDEVPNFQCFLTK